MPIPQPKANETKKKFIQRCMGNPTMVREYKDSAQRRAVCEGAWDKKNDALFDWITIMGLTPCQAAKVFGWGCED
jgi:hypothetical protein